MALLPEDEARTGVFLPCDPGGSAGTAGNIVETIHWVALQITRIRHRNLIFSIVMESFRVAALNYHGKRLEACVNRRLSITATPLGIFRRWRGAVCPVGDILLRGQPDR